MSRTDRSRRSRPNVCGIVGLAGGEKNKDRRYVQRIVLARAGEEDLVLITDLLEAKQIPATDLLGLYRERWGIERMFQQVTEGFGLEGLIGNTPQSMSIPIRLLSAVVQPHPVAEEVCGSGETMPDRRDFVGEVL
jgi:hypothetical protein